MNRYRMLLRVVTTSLTRRKSRVAIAFVALLIGVAITSGLANVYYDIGQKMSRELRAYGANLALTPSSTELQPYMNLEDVSRIAAKIDEAKLIGYVPYLYGVVGLRSNTVVMVGTRFDQMEKVSPYWKIKGEARAAGEEGSIVVGELLAQKLGLKGGDRVRLTSGDALRTKEVRLRGILSTGSKEEAQVFVDLDLAAELLDKPGVANIAYFSILGSLPDLESLAQAIQAEFPGVAANPIKRISQAEGQVLVKIRSLVFLAVGFILLLTLLCVAITMMNGAMERRREVGLKKALGAQERDILLEFLAEGSVLGLLGGLAGWAWGLLFAQGIGQSVFQSSISPRIQLLPLAVFLSTALAGLASFLPARAAARVEPATTLRGE